MAGKRSAVTGLPMCEPAATAATTGKEVFVGPSGNDEAGDGSSTRPYATLEKACGAVGAGDVITLLAGMHKAPQLATLCTGAAGKPVVIRSQTPGAAVFDGTGKNVARGEHLLTLKYVKHVVLDGVEVRNSSGGGVGLHEVNDVVARNLVVHGIGGRGIAAVGEDIVIEGCHVYDAVLINANASGGGGWDNAVASLWRDELSRQPSHNVVFRDNHVHDSWGECMDAFFQDGGAFIGNRIHDCFSVNLYLDHAKDVRVEGNYIYTTTDKYNRRDIGGVRANGIQIALERYDNTDFAPNERLFIANNVITGTNHGVFFWQSDWAQAGNTYKDVVLAYNTIAGVAGAAMFIDLIPAGRPAPVGAKAIANVLGGTRGSVTFDGDGSARAANQAGWTFSDNVLVGNAPGLAGSNGNLAGDPKLTGAMPGGDVDGFRIGDGSPCIDKGPPVATVSRDLWCTARDAAHPTVGAYER